MADKRKSSDSKASQGKSLESRLKAARKAAMGREPRGTIERGAFGVATRLVAELVAGLVVGGGIGWLLDRLLGTKPWMLVVFFILGSIAGIMNVFRAATQMNAGQIDGTKDGENDEDDSGPG